MKRTCAKRCETTKAKTPPALVLMTAEVCTRRKLNVRRTQEGCGGLGGENPAAFLKARPIFQQPFSLPQNAQTLTRIAFRAARKSGKNVPAASKFAGKPFQQGISDSHSLLEFSDNDKRLLAHSKLLAMFADVHRFLLFCS